MKQALLLIGLFGTLAISQIARAADDVDPAQDEFQALLEQRVEAAAKYDQSVRDAAASVTVVTAAEIERFGFRTIDAVLRSVRSFYGTNDRNYAYAGMRGFGRPGDYNNRILLLIDGHAVNDNVFGAAPLGTEMGSIDLHTVDRIEIVRGPGSSLYGANAMLAVINVVTREPKTMSPVRLELESGTGGYMKGAAAFARVLDNGLQMSISGQASQVDGLDLYYSQYDDPSTNNGMADDLDWDEYYEVKGTIRSRDFRIQGVWASREKGIPTAAWGMDFNDPGASTRDEHAFLDATYEHAFSAGQRSVARAYANHYEYEGSWPTGGVDVHDASDGNWYGLELRHLWDVRSNLRVAAGAVSEEHDRADYRIFNDGDMQYYESTSFAMMSGYMQADMQPTPWMSLMLGGRADKYSNYDAAVSPRAGLIVNPVASSAVKLLYGEAFRVPTFYERYYDDPAQGYKANASLEPEQITTTELVWEQDIQEGFSGSVSLFENRFDGLIDTVIDPADSLYTNRNIASARARGVEFELRATAGRLIGYASYSHQRAEDGDGNWLSNSPRNLGKVGFAVPMGVYLRCGIESQYETERLTVYRTTTDPFLLVNLNLTTSFHPFSTRTVASLLVRNVFDEDYSTPGGYEHAQPSIPQDGRTFIVGLETRF